MVGGQMLDIEAETSATPLDDSAIRRLQAMKTGALLRFSVEAGAIVAGADARKRAALVRYGEALGSAFQIADDILDAEATSEQLGKRAGKDAERNKGTFVSIHGLDGAKRLRDAFVEQAIAALGAAGLGDEGDILREAARFVAARAN
jgi:farnesyl diphosphate synthase